MGWLTGWSKRKAITLTGGSDGAFTDFQLKLAIAYDSDMLSDFSDLRFTQEDGEILIDAWLEDKTDGTSADVVVEFPSTPAAGVSEIKGYMYYGKSDALDDWDIGNTFVYGDDFEDGDVSDWYAIHGTPLTEAVTTPAYGSYALHNAGTGAYEYAGKDITTIDNFAIHTKIRAAETNLDHFLYVGQDYDHPIRTLALESDGHLYYLNGTSWTLFPTDTTYSADTWYDVEIRVQTSSDKFEVIWDGTSIGSDLWDTSFDLENCDMIMLGDADNADTYIDNIRVRKYAVNPPTYEFGSEQNAPSGLSMAIVMHHLMQMRRS